MFEDHNSTIYDILAASPEVSKEQLDILYGPEFRGNAKCFVLRTWRRTGIAYRVPAPREL